MIEQTCGGLTTDIILETGSLMEIGSSTSNSCNSRRANATVIKGVNGTCVSHLTVFADSDLDGALVQCSVDNCNGMEIIEVNNTLKLSRSMSTNSVNVLQCHDSQCIAACINRCRLVPASKGC